MPKFHSSIRVRLARVIVPLGKSTDKPAEKAAAMYPPEPSGSTIRFRIPVKLLKEMLEPKRSAAKAPKRTVGAHSKPQFTLPLATVVVPLELKRRKR